MKDSKYLDYSTVEVDVMISWARYLFWARVEADQYEAYEPAEDEPSTGRLYALMAHWYAALWVAIEGWQKLPLTDQAIDELLCNSDFEQYMKLLRRFRNGVYHYQTSMLNNRFTDFFQESNSMVVIWAFLVQSEFERFFWNFCHPKQVSLELQKQLADQFLQIFGWIPSEIPEASPYRINQLYRKAEMSISKSGGKDSREAKELMGVIDKIQLTTREIVDDWNLLKHELFQTLKEQAGVDRDRHSQ